MRDYSVRGMPANELERTRRELAASLALARPGSPVRAPIEAQLSAIDSALAERASAVLRVCGCAFATDNDTRVTDTYGITRGTRNETSAATKTSRSW